MGTPVPTATVVYGGQNGRVHRERTARGSVVIGVRFGQAAPDFSLPSTGGGEVALADFRGKSDVVLVFYCYDWGSI
jgi:AhpC/TSA family